MRQALIVENPKWERFTDASEKFKALSGNAVLVERGRVKERQPTSRISNVVKSTPETPEAYAADLRKLGKKPEEIEILVKDFKPGSLEQIPVAAEPPKPKKGVFKSAAETDEAYEADLRKEGKKPEQIAKLFKKFKPAAAGLLALLWLTGFSAFAQADISAYLPTTELTALSTNTPGSGVLGWNIDDVAVFQLTTTTTNARSAVTHSNIVIYLDTVLQGTTFKTNAYTLTFESPTNAATLTSFQRITNTIGGNLRIGNTCNANTNHVAINNFVWKVK
jgi:hypothetical protein